MSLPRKMRAVQVTALDGKPESISISDLAAPELGPGQVLIKVFASPINPSDLLFLKGAPLYSWMRETSVSSQRSVPAVPGYEGSGRVIAAGPGMLPGLLKGRRVACVVTAPSAQNGMWAEYVVTEARLCIPLLPSVGLLEGATMLVNPLCAWALVSEARSSGHRSLVQTAAASATGKMILRLAQKFSLGIVNVVTKPEHVGPLRGMGARHVFCSTEKAFEERLREACHEAGTTIGFDAIGGEMAGTVLRAMPAHSRLLVYGGLSGQSCKVELETLLVGRKRLEGFWLPNWAQERNLFNQLRIAYKVQKLLRSVLKTDIRGHVPLERAAEAIQSYSAKMSEGKILLLP